MIITNNKTVTAIIVASALLMQLPLCAGKQKMHAKHNNKELEVCRSIDKLNNLLKNDVYVSEITEQATPLWTSWLVTITFWNRRAYRKAKSQDWLTGLRYTDPPVSARPNQKVYTIKATLFKCRTRDIAALNNT